MLNAQSTMRITKLIICAVLLSAVALQSLEAKQRKVVQKPIYMVGVGISLVDSMVFISDMVRVDSVTIEKKTKFLMDRQLYSFQFQRYLEAVYKGGPYVPAVYSSPKRKKMERRYLSLHKRYVQSKELRMILVDQGQFRFKPEKYIEQEEIPIPSQKKDKKKNKS